MADNNKPYQLNKGAILDGRYEIGAVLGEGGFGITYAGINIRSGKEIAIKEFFCLDYMSRSDDGISVSLTDKGARRRFNTERARFMREARILGEFKDDPGVVTVLDYFETGGTAYLVMGYLSGETLHDYVKNNGPYEPKVFFEEIRPLMHTLAKVHEAGVIHRDISPDNIMRMDDGSVVLIDFGSAKDLSGRTVTTATTYKDGFAPPEQYSSGKKLGPETDIYALAATFYYCLTGTKPESAIQRVMFDELRPVHELTGGIPEDIEQMIAKGMALRQADRFSSVTEMEDIIEARYPLLTPEEKERIRKRKRLRRISLATAGVLLLALFTVHFVRNSTMYKMRMQDTQKVFLYWENDGKKGTEEEQKTAKEIIKKRLEIMAGKNNYLWNDDNSENTTTIEIPASVLKDSEPADLFRKYITRPVTNFSIVHADKDAEPVFYDTSASEFRELPMAEFTKDDIATVETGEGIIPTGPDTEASLPYVKIVIKDMSEDMSKEFLQKKGQLLSFLINHEDASSYNIPCFAEGDGRSLYLILQESVDDEEFREVLQNAYFGDGSVSPEVNPVEGEHFRKVLKYDIEHEAADIAPGVGAEPSVKWETPDNILAGDNQVTEKEISGEAILAEWICDYPENISGAEWVNTIVALRERLDSLEVPYAFGITPYDENRVAIKIAEKDINQAELLMLEENSSLYIYNGIEYENLYNARLVKVGNGDNEHVEITVNTSIDLKDVKELIDQTRADNRDSLTVSLGFDGEHPVGRIKISDIDYEQLEKGRLPLTEFGIGGSNENDKAARDRLIRYINTLLTEQSEEDLELERISLYDNKGRFDKFADISEIEGGFYPEYQELAARMDEEIRAASNYEPGFEVSTDITDGDFHMTVYDGSLTHEEFERKVVERAEYLFEKYDLADYEVKIIMKISNGREYRNSAEGEVPSKMAVLDFERLDKYDSEDWAGEYALLDNYRIQIIENGERDLSEEEKATALLNELIRESDILGKYIEWAD